MSPQGLHQSLGQDGGPIFTAFALPYRDGIGFKIDILHPKLHTFINTHPGTVNQICDERRHP